MVRISAVVAASAVLLAWIATAPASGHAGSLGFNPGGGFHGFNPGGGFQGFNPGGGFQGFNPGLVGAFARPRPPQHGPSFPHHRRHRSYSTGGYLIGGYGVPLYYGTSDPLSYDMPAYAPPPVYAAPPVYVPVVVPVPTPVAAAPSSVIEYPEGRYELRGDGASTPFSWVWIPAPPAGPPASTPAPPAPAPAPSSGDRSPARRSQLYRWTDAQGVVHLTNDASTVPEQLRKRDERAD